MKKERKNQKKIQTRKAIGYALILLGLVIIFLKPLTGITGFTIASDSLSFVQDFWFFIVGLGMIIVGLLLSTADVESRAESYDPRTHPDERAYLWKDFRQQPPDPEDIHGFKFYKNDKEKARLEAKRYLGRKFNPDTNAAEYMGADKRVYSLDKHHWRQLINAGASKELLQALIHFDVTDPKTKEKVDEIDLDGKPYDEARKNFKVKED